MQFAAHSPPLQSPNQDWHSLKDHLEGTAALAAHFAAPFGASKAAALAGLIHDLGKYAPAFQSYIRGETKYGVEHAIAGARWLHAMEGSPADRIAERHVAPCTGARIETSPCVIGMGRWWVAPCTGARIETPTE